MGNVNALARQPQTCLCVANAMRPETKSFSTLGNASHAGISRTDVSNSDFSRGRTAVAFGPRSPNPPPASAKTVSVLTLWLWWCSLFHLIKIPIRLFLIRRPKLSPGLVSESAAVKNYFFHSGFHRFFGQCLTDGR